MSRELLTALWDFSTALQDKVFLDQIDPNAFIDDLYVLDIYKKIQELFRRDVFVTPYAINLRTIELLDVCNFTITSDADNNLYVGTRNGIIQILNPMQIASEETI
jgi:hypothetical protein